VDTLLTEALSVVIRWLHVVAGSAWIGSSFYFIHLDLSLRRNNTLPSWLSGISLLCGQASAPRQTPSVWIATQ
jgi:uncharacterized membrane protein